MVELYLNNQLCDLYGSEEIATDYAIAPIANIASRTGAKSVSFKIPLTANNRAIIENANVIVNDSTLPYSLIPAQLKANGLDQNLEYAQIKSVNDDINLTLYGSNIDFFSIIKGRKLSDLDNDYEHVWNLVNAHGSRNNTSGYIYGIIDYHSDSPNAYINDSDDEIDVRGLLPCVFLHSLISQIITEAGFTAQGDFLTDADYKDVLIPALGDGDKITRTVSVTFTLTDFDKIALALGSAYSQTIIKSGMTLSLRGVTDTSEYITFVKTEDTIIDGTELNFLEVESSNILYLTTGNFDYVFGTGNVNVIEGLTIGNQYKIETIYTLNYNNPDLNTFIQFQYLFWSGAAFPVAIENTLDSFLFGRQFGATFNSSWLPDLKQSDLLKDTCQKFGLILQVNNQTKVVSIRQFSEIIANIPNALDWSDKVDYTEKPEIEFESDYAQRNLCIYKDDDSVVKPVGTDSEILIDNDNLEAEKELFESPFAASEQVDRFGGYSIAQIKYFTGLGTADETTENVDPRYLIKRMEEFSVFTYSDGTNTFTASSVPVTHFILPEQSFNVGFENNLLDNSSDLIAMIQQFKSVKMLLRLTPSDINQLDFFTPVWIEIKGQPGCYFYISVIKQFKVTSKESTEVELVKLIT